MTSASLINTSTALAAGTGGAIKIRLHVDDDEDVTMDAASSSPGGRARSPRVSQFPAQHKITPPPATSSSSFSSSNEKVNSDILLSGEELKRVVASLKPVLGGLKNAALTFCADGVVIQGSICGQRLFVPLLTSDFTRYFWIGDPAVFLSTTDARRTLLDAFRPDKKRVPSEVTFSVSGSPPGRSLSQTVIYTGESCVRSASAIKYELWSSTSAYPFTDPDVSFSLSKQQMGKIVAVAGRVQHEALTFGVKPEGGFYVGTVCEVVRFDVDGTAMTDYPYSSSMLRYLTKLSSSSKRDDGKKRRGVRGGGGDDDDEDEEGGGNDDGEGGEEKRVRNGGDDDAGGDSEDDEKPYKEPEKNTGEKEGSALSDRKRKPGSGKNGANAGPKSKVTTTASPSQRTVVGYGSGKPFCLALEDTASFRAMLQKIRTGSDGMTLSFYTTQEIPMLRVRLHTPSSPCVFLFCTADCIPIHDLEAVSAVSGALDKKHTAQHQSGSGGGGNVGGTGSHSAKKRSAPSPAAHPANESVGGGFDSRTSGRSGSGTIGTENRHHHQHNSSGASHGVVGPPPEKKGRRAAVGSSSATTTNEPINKKRGGDGGSKHSSSTSRQTLLNFAPKDASVSSEASKHNNNHQQQHHHHHHHYQHQTTSNVFGISSE